MKNTLYILLALVAGVVVVVWDNLSEITGVSIVAPTPVDPNWAMITAWPNIDRAAVEAAPNPNRRITAVVLDDSGSMGADIVPAKAAVLASLDAMADQDRVAVVALNRGLILPFMSVADARTTLPDAIRPVRSDGSTPLTAAVRRARDLLEEEAAVARGFGTYRMIVTTDGQADDGTALTSEVEDIAEKTPIQIATIGISVSGRHVLRRDDLGRFVDISDIGALEQALQAAIAENTAFAAITAFEGDS